jgi:hypothetical protein
MRRLPLVALALCLTAPLAPAQQDEKVFSGPQPGEKLTPFKVLGVFGPQAGKEFELAPPAKDGPAVIVFVHEMTRPANQCLRLVDLYADRLARDGLHTHIVWLSADKTAAEMAITRIQGSVKYRSPIGISLDGAEGPGNYGLNRKVTLTVLVAKGNKVVANFAIVQPNETDAPKVLAAIAKVMGKQPPTVEELGGAKGRPDQPPKRPADMADVVKAIEGLTGEVRRLQGQVAALTAALDEARAKLAKLEGKPAPPPLGGKRPEGKPSKSPELQQLMRQMIQKTNDEATVKRIADEMLRWAGDDRRRLAELRDYCRLIVGAGYGTEAAQQALKKLAGE